METGKGLIGTTVIETIMIGPGKGLGVGPMSITVSLEIRERGGVIGLGEEGGYTVHKVGFVNPG